MTVLHPMLPRGVVAVTGETPLSYLQRLAAANMMSASMLWSHMRTLEPSLPYGVAAPVGVAVLEMLGGLAPGWFALDRSRNLLPRRCPHTGWRAAVLCDRCGQPPAEASGCRRCADGANTRVRSRSGPVCLKHQMWHHDDVMISVRADSSYVVAERVLQFRLMRLGVGSATGEIQLASQLLASWIRDRPYERVLRRWQLVECAGYAPLGTEAFWTFPEAVSLVEVLTDPGFVSYLLSPRWSAAVQAELLVAAVTGVVGDVPPPSLTPAAADVVEHGTLALRTAYGICSTRSPRHRATFERALMVAARQHRACLLRHLDSVRLPNLRLGAAPAYIATVRTLVNASPQPDHVVPGR